jgi:hypothetical protein
MPALTTDYAIEIGRLTTSFALAVEREHYFPKSFGDGIVILSGPALRMRVIRERLQLFIELEESDDRWRDADDELQSMGLQPTPGVRLAFPRLVDVLCANAPRFLQQRLLNVLQRSVALRAGPV